MLQQILLSFNLMPSYVKIQPATVTDEVFEKIQEKRENIIETLNIDADNILKQDQKQQLIDLLRKHQDILSTGDTDIGICNRIKHRI